MLAKILFFIRTSNIAFYTILCSFINIKDREKYREHGERRQLINIIKQTYGKWYANNIAGFDKVFSYKVRDSPMSSWTCENWDTKFLWHFQLNYFEQRDYCN